MSIHQPHHQNLGEDSVYNILKKGSDEVEMVDLSEGDMRTILLNRCGIEAMNDEYWKQEGMRHLEGITAKMAA